MVLFVNKICEATPELTVCRVRNAIDILGGPNRIRTVQLHTTERLTNARRKNSKRWPCILQCILPVNRKEGILLEIRIWGLTSGNDKLETKALQAILEYAGFESTASKVHKILFHHHKILKLRT